MNIVLRPGQLSLPLLRQIARGRDPIVLDDACHPAIARSAATVADIVARGDTVYGINTGFGRLATTSIPADRLTELQVNLVLSHSAGLGPLLDDDVVRLIMALKVGSLARGHSGVRPIVVETLLRLLAAEVYPAIPCKGSVGASGDLAPLAHLAAAMIGVGEVRVDGQLIPATDGLARADLAPLELAPKEGLALLNGTQVSTALALRGLFACEDAFAGAVVAGALSVEAARGSRRAYDVRIHEVRGQAGQIDVATAYRALLRDSEIATSHANCGRVQDPYSLRCQPQVMGACLDHLRFASCILEREANAVSDNPLVFAEEGEVLSGGNFHAEPVAMAADVIALVIAEIGSLSERRVALLMDDSLSGLPAFLAPDTGTHSGFMIAQVTAAALASENKGIAHPACVDSLPTSANQEDHVSMATYAARRLTEMADNTAGIVGIEVMAATCGIDLLAPLRTSEPLAAVMTQFRRTVRAHDGDRFLAPDITAARDWVQSGAPREHAVVTLPSDDA